MKQETLDALEAEIGKMTAVSEQPVHTEPGAGSAAEAPAISVAAPGCVSKVDHAARGWDLDLSVSPGRVVGAAEVLRREGFAIDTITGVDWLAANEMEVVYDYFHPRCGSRVVVRTRVPRDQAEVPTIRDVFAGADWHERETHELLGIRFAGHPNLTPLLLPEDADYHPLRKDFTGVA